MTLARTRERQNKLALERKRILNRTLERNKKSKDEYNNSPSVFTRLNDIERNEAAEKLTIMDPIIEKRKLDKHNRHLKLLISIIEESKLENSQSLIKIWDMGILQEGNYRSFNYINNTYYYINYIDHTPLTLENLDAAYESEIRWLQLTAKQYSVSDIAVKLAISERTVNYHLQKLNKQLGTTNKHMSVAKAQREKLIE